MPLPNSKSEQMVAMVMIPPGDAEYKIGGVLLDGPHLIVFDLGALQHEAKFCSVFILIFGWWKG